MSEFVQLLPATPASLDRNKMLLFECKVHNAWAFEAGRIRMQAHSFDQRPQWPKFCGSWARVRRGMARSRQEVAQASRTGTVLYGGALSISRLLTVVRTGIRCEAQQLLQLWEFAQGSCLSIALARFNVE